MNLRIKIKPNIYGHAKFHGNTKESMIRRIGLNYSSHGYYRISGNSNSIFGINFEKRRKKVKFTKFKSGPNKGKIKSVEVIHPAHWVAYVYEFPKSYPIEIIQGNRTFTIKQKQK